MKALIFKSLFYSVMTIALLFPHPAAADEVITEDISLNPEVITVTEPEGASPDELFADYVDSILYGKTTDGRKRAASNKLSGLDLTVYNLLKERIEKVAAGELESTEFLLSSEELGLEGMTWTAEQIGTDAIVVYDETQGKNVISKDALNALNEYLDVHYSLIFKTLLAEMPYSLYWFDKTTGWSYYNFGASYDGTEWFLTAASGLRFRFAVSSEYSSEGSQYTVDTSVGQAVTAARSTAAGIVANYTSFSDYERLKGYKDSICSLVSYNNSAANGGAPYGNPWQLIWVFDNDPDTNVVCEGYAKAFKYLCDLSSFTGEIDCLLATGEMDGGTGAGGHMWNIVNMDDGKNYLVDVTNCDAGTVGAPDKLFLVGNADGSAASGYTFALSKSISFTYDSDTLALFSDDELTLAVSNYDPNAVHVHSWDAGVVTKEATCIETGEITYTCSCGETKTEELPVDSTNHTGHTELRNASEATYDSEGYTGDTYCADCGTLLETGEPIPVLDNTVSVVSLEYDPLDRCIFPDCIEDSEYLNGDTVTVHYSDGMSETYIYDASKEYYLDPAYGYPYQNVRTGCFVSQTDGTVMPIFNHPDCMITRYDPETKALTISHKDVSATCNDAVYEAESISFKQAKPASYKEGVNSESRIDENGTEYAYYPFVDYNGYDTGDQLTVDYKNSRGEMITLNFSISEFINVFTTDDYRAANAPIKGADLHIEYPDQASAHYVPGSYSVGVYWQKNADGPMFRSEGTPYQYEILPADPDVSFDSITLAADSDFILPEDGDEITYPDNVYISEAEPDDYTADISIDYRWYNPKTGETYEKSQGDSGVFTAGEWYFIIELSITTVGDGFDNTDFGTLSFGGLDFSLYSRDTQTVELLSEIQIGSGKPVTAISDLVLEADHDFQIPESGQAFFYPDNVHISSTLPTGLERIPEIRFGWDTPDGIFWQGEDGPAEFTAGDYKMLMRIQIPESEQADYYFISNQMPARFDLNGCVFETDYGPSNNRKYLTYVSDTISVIEKTAIAEEWVSTPVDAVYTGTPFYITVENQWMTLVRDRDYTVEYQNNINAGTAHVTIKGINDYTGIIEKEFKIAPKNIAPVVTLSATSYTYDGKVKTPSVTVKDGGTPLVAEKDYTVTLPSGRKNAGSYTITVNLTGNYAGRKSVTYKINKAAQTITAKAAASSVAVGKATTISVSGTKESPKLTYKSSDTGIAAVSTAGKITAKKVGTVKITVTAAATTNYVGKSVPVTVKVVPAATTSVSTANLAKGIKVTWKKVTGATGYYVYRNGKQIQKISNENTVTCADTAATSNGGKYIYKVTAYALTGTSTLSKSVTTYQVARPTISSLTSPRTKQLIVKWGKNAKATGYQIQYSTSSTFASGSKTVTVKGAANISKTITSLLAKKRYYVRIRTYMTVSGKNYYSAWSAVKNVVTK